MKEIRLPFTADSDGNATVNGAYAVFGKLYAVMYAYGNAHTNTDLTLTCESADGSKPLLTKANAGTADAWFYPRDLVHGVEDGAALTGTAGGDRVEPILAGVPKLVVAQATNATTGTVILYYCD